MKISKGFLLALIIIFIVTFVIIGFSQKDKKEGTCQEIITVDQQKPSEKDLKPQEEKKPEEKKITPSEEVQQRYGYDVMEIIGDTQRTLDRSINTLNIVATLISILVGLLILIFTISGVTGFFQFRSWTALRKHIEEDAKYIKETRNKAEKELDSLRKQIGQVPIPSLTEKLPIKFKEAFDHFGRRLDNFEIFGLPLSYGDYNNRGLDYLNKEEYLLALKEFEKAIELKSDDAKAWYYKGYALYHVVRYYESLEALNKAIDLNPNYTDALHQKGCTLLKLGRDEKALVYFEKAIELQPIFQSWIGKALSLYNLKRYDEALIAYDKSVELDPNYAEAWYYRAAIYSIKQNREKALSDLTRAIELDDSYKNKAKKREDFKEYWEDAEFKKITS